MTEEPSSSRWFNRLWSRKAADIAQTLDTDNRVAQEQMMTAAEAFHHLRVEDVMVPRADIVAVDVSMGLHELSLTFRDKGHSRLPVYKETLDDPLGAVHIKDMLPYLMLDARGRNGKSYADKKVVASIYRPVIFVPASMLAQDLLRRMQARRTHMAIVVDEYGGTDGLVTLEDLVEPIVGDIEDEHGEDEPQVLKMADTSGRSIWEADARVSIDDFEAVFGRDFATPDEEDDVDTLGGLVFTLAGRVPERGELIYHPDGIEFEVLDADPRRVKKLRIQSREQTLKGDKSQAAE